MRVLLVDDDEDTCDVFCAYFSMLGHVAESSLSAYDALERISKTTYDAIVLDVFLRDIDGYALACRVRRLLAYKQKPIIIAASGTGYDPHNPLAGEADFDAFLRKPVDMESISAALNRHQMGSSWIKMRF